VAERRPNEGLPVAVSTVVGFLGTLLVLLAGTANGTRPWVLLMRAAIAFLLISGFLKLLAAGLLQVLQWRKTVSPAKRSEFAEEIEGTIETIATSVASTGSKPKGVA
jgi:hypothetical protein